MSRASLYGRPDAVRLTKTCALATLPAPAAKPFKTVIFAVMRKLLVFHCVSTTPACHMPNPLDTNT